MDDLAYMLGSYIYEHVKPNFEIKNVNLFKYVLGKVILFSYFDGNLEDVLIES